MSGDESEDNGNSVATESDFEDIFDENFQPDFYCSSRENTDSESEPEIKVVDLTIDTAPDTMVNTNRVKSLAALFEEAFRATEKATKKAVPKEDVTSSMIIPALGDFHLTFFSYPISGTAFLQQNTPSKKHFKAQILVVEMAIINNGVKNISKLKYWLLRWRSLTKCNDPCLSLEPLYYRPHIFESAQTRPAKQFV
ncbi:hypothetical protein YC2023_101222 [Brassica napus]